MELDTLVVQFLGLFLGRLAVDAALLGIAVVNPSRFGGELIADVVAIFHHLLANPTDRSENFFGNFASPNFRVAMVRAGVRANFRAGLQNYGGRPAARDVRRHDGF